MRSNGVEVIANADRRYLVRRIIEKLQAVDLRRVQVSSEHVATFGGKHEHIARLDPNRRSLAIEAEPALALHDCHELDLARRRESQRPRLSSHQDAHLHAPGACQRQDVCERVFFHCY